MTNSAWLWVLRALWVSLPFTAGPLLLAALEEGARSFELVGTVGLWALWGAGLTSMLIPHTSTLTVVRIVGPLSLALAIAAAITAGSTPERLIGLSVTALVAVVVLSAAIAAEFVNGSSYGDERRLPLRPPASLLLGPVPLAWALAVAGPTVGLLLVAGEKWVAGGVVLVVGLPLSYLAVRALHRLTKRWVVFVPAGMVLADHLTLADPVLFRRAAVANLGPALADTAAHDLTLNASGLPLQLDLNEDAPLSLTESAKGALQEGDVIRSLLFAPSQPGEVLAEAEARRIHVG